MPRWMTTHSADAGLSHSQKGYLGRPRHSSRSHVTATFARTPAPSRTGTSKKVPSRNSPVWSRPAAWAVHPAANPMAVPSVTKSGPQPPGHQHRDQEVGQGAADDLSRAVRALEGLRKLVPVVLALPQPDRPGTEPRRTPEQQGERCGRRSPHARTRRAAQLPVKAWWGRATGPVRPPPARCGPGAGTAPSARRAPRRGLNDHRRQAAGPEGHSGAATKSSAADRSPLISTSDKSLPGPAEPHATPPPTSARVSA
jgi:hypothetical protein